MVGSDLIDKIDSNIIVFAARMNEDYNRERGFRLKRRWKMYTVWLLNSQPHFQSAEPQKLEIRSFLRSNVSKMCYI